eukprot:6192928-Pleurochrysis_carterae.AAC.2
MHRVRAFLSLFAPFRALALIRLPTLACCRPQFVCVTRVQVFRAALFVSVGLYWSIKVGGKEKKGGGCGKVWVRGGAVGGRAKEPSPMTVGG